MWKFYRGFDYDQIGGEQQQQQQPVPQSYSVYPVQQQQPVAMDYTPKAPGTYEAI